MPAAKSNAPPSQVLIDNRCVDINPSDAGAPPIVCPPTQELINERCVDLSQTVPCSDVAPQNATSVIEDVIVTMNAVGTWSSPSPCVWNCNTDYISEDALTCINSKVVTCDATQTPANAQGTSQEVTLSYTSAAGWTNIPPCEFSCLDGFIEDGENQCINEKEVLCDDSNIPDNALALPDDVTITYSPAIGWEAPAECDWVCTDDFTSEDGATCINTKTVSCVIDNVPPYAYPVVEDRTIIFTSAAGWSVPETCTWA